MDTSTSMGEAIVGIMAVLAQLRVSTIKENTMRGLAHARTPQGRIGGRPSVMTPERLETAQQMRTEGKPHQKIADTLGVGRATISRALRTAEATAEDNMGAEAR